MGSLIQEAKLLMEDGSSTTMFYANFLVYLAAVYHHGGSMFQLIQRQHLSNPSSMEKP